MSRWAELYEAATENPSFDQDLGRVLSPLRLAFWLSLLNLAILGISASFLISFRNDPAMHGMLNRHGLGTLLLATTQLALAVFYTLLVPIRVTRIIDGPRADAYFDQVVTTGISPLRLFLGQWASTQIFILTAAAATLPYVLLFICFGAESWMRPMLNFGLIILYANLLLILTIAMSCITNDWSAVGAIYFMFGLAALFEFAPVNSSYMLWTPLRDILAPFLQDLYGKPYSASFFGIGLPPLLLKLSFWSLLALLSGAVVLMGPRHVFRRGYNNFEGIVLPGDSKKSMMFRKRKIQNRQIQLAFFFENRPQWCLRHDALIRAGMTVLFCLSVLGYILGGFLNADFYRRVGANSGLILAPGVPLVALLGLLVFGLGRDRYALAAGWKSPSGVVLPQMLIDLGVLCTVIMGSLGFLALSAFANWSSLQGVMSAPLGMRGSLFFTALEFYGIGIVTALGFLLALFYLGRKMGNPGGTQSVAFLLLIFVMLGPMVLGLIASQAQEIFALSEGQASTLEYLSALAQVSPLRASIRLFNETGTLSGWPDFIDRNAFWIFAPALLLIEIRWLFSAVARGSDLGAEVPIAERPLPILLSERAA